MKRQSAAWFGAALSPFAATALIGCAVSDPTPAPAPSDLAQPRSTLAAAGPSLSARRAGVPAWASAARFVGTVEASQTIAVQVHLSLRNGQAAAAELEDIADPDSPRYGRFLSDDEYAAKYAPTDDDVAVVAAHLVQSGLTITHVPANRAYVSAEGPASAVEQAFATKLGQFQVQGAIRRAPLTEVQLPSAVSSRVAGVLGLSPQTFRSHRVHVGGLRPGDGLPPGTVVGDTASTCSEWFGQIPDTTDPPYPGYAPLTNFVCGYHPGNLRDGYGLADVVGQGNDGRGQSVAIVDAFLSPTLLQDAQMYFDNNDPDHPLAPSQFSARWAPGTSTPPDVGWYGEQSLDVEAVHAIAPGASIAYVGAQSADDQDLVAAINLVIQNRLATIVSNSYGAPEGGGDVDFVIWHNIATQAGLKGIGLYFSSGDNGDESQNIGFPSADFPASLDNVTAVGGTSLALGERDQRLFEVGWETGASMLDTTTEPPSWDPPPPGTFEFGSGGGTSLVYEQPRWQKGIVPTAIANVNGAPARAVPDVSMLGDPFTGYFIGQTDPTTGVYGEFAIGGTSLSCPLFSATMALAQQHAKQKFGFAAPLLYKRHAAALRDIAPLAVPEAVGFFNFAVSFDDPAQTIQTGPGWDAVTGLGVPSGAKFLAALCK